MKRLVPCVRRLGTEAQQIHWVTDDMARRGPCRFHHRAGLRHASYRSLSTGLPARRPSNPENVGVPDERGIRKWYYVIDSHGQLFLHDTVPKNFATCYKDKRFLDFFFKRLAPNTTHYHRGDYDWMSPCGRELNFVYAEDTPIVFQELTSDGNLVWGGTMKYPFDPSKLTVDASTGHLYHPSPMRLRRPSNISSFAEGAAACGRSTLDNSHLGRGSESDNRADVLAVALLRSSLVLDRLELTDDGSAVIWEGRRYPIRIEDVKVR